MMRFTITCLSISMSVLPTTAMAVGTALVNGSFETGDLTGWSIQNYQDAGNYHDPPATQCVCGDIYDDPDIPYPHEHLTAVDGTYFGGLTYITHSIPNARNDVRFCQAVEVANWDPNADRTDFDLEIWVNMAHSGVWQDGYVRQEYNIQWREDGALPPDVLDVGGFRYRIATADSTPFTKGILPSFNNWRQLTLSGSIADNPQYVVLEILLSYSTDPPTCHNVFDGVVFSARSATGSSIGPFAGDIPNSDFEEPPYNTSHYYDFPDPPSGWMYFSDFEEPNRGPIEGYTNGMTDPTDPLGTVTSSGEHFWGRAMDLTSGGGRGCEGWWGHVLEVRNWDPCAIGMRWHLHYLTKLWDSNDSAFETMELCWDAEGSGYSVLDPPDEQYQAWMLRSNWFSWIEIVDINDRSFAGASQSSDFIEVEQSGEFVPTDADGLDSCPRYVLLRNRTYAYGGANHDQPFKIMYDKVDFYVEAILSDALSIRNAPVLPATDCTQLYSVKLNACGAVEPSAFTLITGDLPPGLRLSSDGRISGQPAIPGTYVFTVELEDATPESVTKEFEISVADGDACCGAVPADFDGDEDIDQEDFALFQACYTGIEGGIPAGCQCADLDRDGLNIDQADLNVFERCATGPTIPISDPNCDKEACCLPDGGCADVHPVLCADRGGTAQGSGTDCDTASCEPSQACCMSDGGCQDLTESQCLSDSGYPQGIGTDCFSASCPQPQGCCLEGGDCQMLLVNECTDQGGVPRGAGVGCTEACTEACCYNSSGYCIDVPPAECPAAYATTQGPGTVCLPNHVCPN